jgi:hypothetical protein
MVTLMHVMPNLLVPTLVIAAIVFVVLLALQARWGMRSVTDTGVYVLARLVPTVSTNPQRMLGKIGLRLRGSPVITASGAKGAAAVCTVVLGTFSLDQVLSQYPEAEIGVEFADMYVAHAIREGWKIPLGGCAVVFAEDVSMCPGWVRIETRPGSYLRATPAHRDMRAVTPEPRRPTIKMSEDEMADLMCGDNAEVTWRLPDVAETRIAGAAPLRLVADVGSASVALPIVGEALSVGRDRSNMLVLRDDLVSRIHAEIHVKLEDLVVQDLESRNGTWVNGRRITCPTQVRAGDTLSFALQGPSFKILAARPAQTSTR